MPKNKPTITASKFFILPGIFLFMAMPCLWAEDIELNSGEHVQGKILKKDAKEVVVDTGIGGNLTYYVDEIKEIRGIETSIKNPGNGPVDPLEEDVQTQADKIENQAVEHIDQGDMDQGLELMRQAIELYPTPIRHMNYGSVLFGNGVSMFKEGKTDEGTAVLKQAKAHLEEAIKNFDERKDGMNLSQCYFLLGEMANNAFGDAAKAKQYYEKAVHVYDHPAAEVALSKLSKN